MPLRKKEVVTKEFRYDSVAECESNEDAHEMHPTVWPPTNHARNSVEEPSTTGRCVLCNCHLTAYKSHGLQPDEPGYIPGIRIVLPSKARKSA